MSYNDLLCPHEVVGNHLELLGASSGALCNFFQWMGKLDPLQAPPKREVFRQIFDFAIADHHWYTILFDNLIGH